MPIDLDELIQRNIQSGAEIETVGPTPVDAIYRAQTMLGVSFPPSYTDFLARYGAIEVDGRSFAGLPSREVGADGDVVSFTRYAREKFHLPEQYVALNDQDGDAFLCIDTKNTGAAGESPIVLVSPIDGHQLGRPAADSFAEYLANYLAG